MPGKVSGFSILKKRHVMRKIINSIMKKALILLITVCFLGCGGCGDGDSGKALTISDLAGEYVLSEIELTCPEQHGTIYASESFTG